LQEQGRGFRIDEEFLLLAHLRVLLLLFGDAAGVALSAGSQANVVLLQNGSDLLVGLGSDHDFLRFLRLLLIACLHTLHLRGAVVLLHVFFLVAFGDRLPVAAAVLLLAQLSNVSQLQKREVQRLC
jgi:hypothetical protein